MVIDILHELFHGNIAYHVVRYLGPHHLAGIMKPQTSNEGQFNEIRYGTCKYHGSSHRENELSSHYWNRLVIDLTELDPLFVHMNKAAIEEIIYSDEFRIIEDQYD